MSLAQSPEVDKVLAALGNDVHVSVVTEALRRADNNINLAVNMILDNPARFVVAPASVKEVDTPVAVKEDDSGTGFIKKDAPFPLVKEEKLEVDVDVDKKVTTPLCPLPVKKEVEDVVVKEEPVDVLPVVKEEPMVVDVKKEKPDMATVLNRKLFDGYGVLPRDLTTTHFSPYLNPRPISCLPPSNAADRRLQVVQPQCPIEDGDFPEESDWFLVGRTNIMGLSTSRGKGKLACDEIVHFKFPQNDVRHRVGRHWTSKAATAISEIVRFSTQRSGEV